MTRTQNTVNPYQVLGLSDFAPMEDVSRRYRELAKKYHPDINPGHEQDMKAVNNAYDMIKSGWIPPEEPEEPPKQQTRQQRPKQPHAQYTQYQEPPYQQTQRQAQPNPKDISLWVNMCIDRRKVKKLEHKWRCTDDEFVPAFQKFVDLRCFSYLAPGNGQASSFPAFAETYWNTCLNSEQAREDPNRREFPIVKDRGITVSFPLYFTDDMRTVMHSFADNYWPQGYDEAKFAAYCGAQVREWIYEYSHERI